jgi:hypothetical protein
MVADTMPHPGDVSPGFIAEADRCWRMVYDHNLQATHCADAPRWTSPTALAEGRPLVGGVACPDHLDGLTGLREFGRRRNP